MTRRVKWVAPNNPTVPAKQIWKYLFPGDPWPKGWRVIWKEHLMGAVGLTYPSERVIMLSYRYAKDRNQAYPVQTLCHEFLHVIMPDMLHGEEFNRIVNGYLVRLGLPPTEGM